MITAKVTTKSQITIPKKVRNKLGIRPGEGLVFEEKDGLFYIRKAMKKSPFDKWVGRLKDLKGLKSDEILEDLRGK